MRSATVVLPVPGLPVKLMCRLGGADSSKQVGNALLKPIGARPARPDRRPPYNRDRACHENPIPDINGAETTVGP